jgi:hypothetical protein
VAKPRLMPLPFSTTRRPSEVDHLEARRRSPGWVRDLTRDQLHGLALSLRRRWWEGVASSHEEWLLDACCSELEYRRRNGLRRGDAKVCSCELCLPPFDDALFE